MLEEIQMTVALFYRVMRWMGTFLPRNRKTAAGREVKPDRQGLSRCIKRHFRHAPRIFDARFCFEQFRFHFLTFCCCIT